MEGNSSMEIRVFSPASFPSPRKSWMDSLDLVYQASLPSETFAGFARSDEQRAIELNNILSSNVLAMASRGGYGCQRMLPHLDIPQRIEAKLCGFSDLTVLLNYLYQKYDALCFHGPMMQWPNETQMSSLMWQSFQSIVLKNSQFDCTFQGQFLNCKALNGPIIGGNLSVICASLGTPYAPNLSGKLLFLEDINEPTYKIDRMLDQLSKQSDFKNLRGMLFGSFNNCNISPNDSGDLNINELITDFCSRYQIPAIIGLPVGHLDDFVCFRIGSQVRFEALSKSQIFWRIEGLNGSNR